MHIKYSKTLKDIEVESDSWLSKDTKNLENKILKIKLTIDKK